MRLFKTKYKIEELYTHYKTNPYYIKKSYVGIFWKTLSYQYGLSNTYWSYNVTIESTSPYHPCEYKTIEIAKKRIQKYIWNCAFALYNAKREKRLRKEFGKRKIVVKLPPWK